MNEKQMTFPMAKPQGRLECKEIFGGIHNQDIDISAGKITASVYSAACCGGKGGDIYYIGVCKDESISRVAIADVVGHGESVSKISQYVYDQLESHM